MGSLVRISRKHQIVVPKEARKSLGVGSGDELIVEVEKGKIVMKPRPRSYTQHLLGLHKRLWKGVGVEDYVSREREAWR